MGIPFTNRMLERAKTPVSRPPSLGGIDVPAVLSPGRPAPTVKTAVLLGLKAANGGLFVVVFALVSEVLTPKRFAGLFSAAPSVALANLAVIVAAKGHAEAIASARGMLLGAAAFAASAALGAVVARHRGVRVSSLVVCGTWILVALPLYALLMA